MTVTQSTLLFGGTCEVPDSVAVCPECCGTLRVTSESWDPDTGVPIAVGIAVDCIEDEKDIEADEHRWWQSDWQPVIDVVRKWCGAI